MEYRISKGRDGGMIGWSGVTADWWAGISGDLGRRGEDDGASGGVTARHKNADEWARCSLSRCQKDGRRNE